MVVSSILSSPRKTRRLAGSSVRSATLSSGASASVCRLSKALTLASKAGLDPEVVFNAIKGGLAGSTVLNAKAPMVCSRNFKPGFRINLHQKDLRNTLQAAESLQTPLPITSLVQQMLVSLINDGKGDLDHSGIVQYTEGNAKVEIKGGGSDFDIRPRKELENLEMQVRASNVSLSLPKDMGAELIIETKGGKTELPEGVEIVKEEGDEIRVLIGEEPDSSLTIRNDFGTVEVK